MPTWLALSIELTFGVLSFLVASSFKRYYGVNLWHLPSLVWGLIGFILPIFCTIPLLIARRTTRVGPRESGPSTGYGQLGGSGSYRMDADHGFPSGSRGQWRALPVSPSGAPPGWYGDPGRHHQLRYWNGAQWTEFVSDAGTTSTDFNDGASPG